MTDWQWHPPSACKDAGTADASEITRLREEVERLTKEADGEFVRAACRVMRANPGFYHRDYEDGITADEFEEFFTEDMNEAWRSYEKEKARADAAESRVKELEHHAKIGASCEMHGLAHVDEAGEVWTSPPPELFRERIKELEDALVRIKFLRPAGPSRNKMVEEMERIACIALDPTEFRSRTEGEG